MVSNDPTLDILEKTGLKAGFTVEYNVVNHTSNPFKLGRFQVKNWKPGNLKKNC
jgi:hypothetical protein